MLAKGRFVLCNLAILLAASLACSAVAAAEEQPHYIKKGVEIKEALKGKGTIGEFFIDGEIGLKEVVVLCTGIDNKVMVGGSWKSTLTIEFTKCHVFFKGELIEECEVKEPIVVALNGQLIYKNHKNVKGEELFEIFYPSAGKKFKGSTFAKVTLLGIGCGVLEGVYTVTGSAIGSLSPNKSGEEVEKIKITFNGGAGLTGTYENHETGVEEEAGKLTLNNKAATLKGEIVQELETKEKYGAS